MAGCDVLDLRCIFVNELIGSVALTGIFVVIIYFMIASKLRFGADTTLAFSIPFILLGALAVGIISPVMAFITMLVGFMAAELFTRIIAGR